MINSSSLFAKKKHSPIDDLLFQAMFTSCRDPNYKIFLTTRKIHDQVPYLYETVLTHPAYNDGKTFRIGHYTNHKDAVEGNEYWHENIRGATQIATNGGKKAEDFLTDQNPSPSCR